MTMTFKEALIAHLQGQKVEVSGVSTMPPWRPFMEYHGNVSMKYVDDPDFAGACEYRIAPRTILVNGVEVPAPEKDAPKDGDRYFSPSVTMAHSFSEHYTWDGSDFDQSALDRGVVYLNEDHAVARAKAMLITQEVK